MRKKSPASSTAPERRLPPLLRKAWYGLNQSFRRRIRRHSATPDQFTVLRLLCEAGDGGRSQRELCRLMASDPNTIGALISRMCKTALVERQIDERDKRAHRVVATKRGRQVFKSLRTTALLLQEEILSALPAKRREQFLADLEAVANACGAMADMNEKIAV